MDAMCLLLRCEVVIPKPFHVSTSQARDLARRPNKPDPVSTSVPLEALATRNSASQ
jgi:hypothetical protein